MDHPHVLLHYEREFPYPVDKTYAWLTDYQDDDHERAGAIINRRIVTSRTDREVHLDGELETMGIKTNGTAVVKLYPEERRWVAFLGKGGRWEYEYRVVPTPQGGTRLLVDYRFGSRRWTRRLTLWLAKPKIRREIDQMWDGFAAAMARELAAAPAPARAAME